MQRVAAVADGGMEAVVESTIERWFSEGYRASGAARIDDVRHMIRTTAVAGYTGCARAIQTLANLDRLGSTRPSRPADRRLAGPRHPAGRHAR